MSAFDDYEAIECRWFPTEATKKPPEDRWLKMERETRLELATFSLGS